MNIEQDTGEELPEFFTLDDCLYHYTQILFLQLDGGVGGSGCWGQIQIRGEKRCIIGDGSYAEDQEPMGRHVRHRVAGEYNFRRLRQIMRLRGIAESP